MKLSVVITTRNEEANIANCLNAFSAFRREIELIVVDNNSEDNTKAIAADLGAKVFNFGPERSAQRNFGWKHASAPWILILDADMILREATIIEILEKCRENTASAYWIGEVRSGKGFRVKARNFERSFYNGTVIDALRLFAREVLERTLGYDETLIAGPEDWDLDIRVLNLGVKCEVLRGQLIHNEKTLTFKKMLAKKAYYAKSMARYRAKWPNHEATKKQFSLWYRYFGVFLEKGKWKKVLRHPILFIQVFIERVAVGIVYLRNR